MWRCRVEGRGAGAGAPQPWEPLHAAARAWHNP